MIYKGDIVECINVNDESGNRKIKVGSRYIVKYDCDEGQICIINPCNPVYGWLCYGEYILYKRSIKNTFKSILKSLFYRRK